MIVIVAVMVVIVAGAGALFAVVASTQNDSVGFGAKLAKRVGVKRVDDRGTLRSLNAMRGQSTARQD